MVRTRTLNNLVACEPFAKHGIQSMTTSAGLAIAANFTTMTKLRVLADGPEGIEAGDWAHIPSNLNKASWATQVFQDEHGAKFILVPLASVFLVEQGPLPPPPPRPPRPAPTSVPGPGTPRSEV